MTIDELNSTIFIFRSTSQFLFLLPLSYLHNPLFLIYIYFLLHFCLSSTIDSKTHTFLHFPSLHIFLRLSKFFFIFHVTLQAYVSSLFLSRARTCTRISTQCVSFSSCRGAFIWSFLVGRD